MADPRSEFLCRFCGGRRSKKTVSTIDPLTPDADPTDLHQCQDCGIVSVHPIPDASFRQSAYAPDKINSFLSAKAPLRRFVDIAYTFFHPYSLKWRVKNVQKTVGMGRILDVGCGSGDFLMEMRQHLWEVVGVEPNPARSDFAAGTLGLTVVAQMQDLLPRYENYFDVITFWHSFGHFEDPPSTLDLSLRLLRPNGKLLIALPNILSLDFRIYRDAWVALDVPRRLFQLSPNQMRTFIRARKLKLKHKKSIPFDIYYNCLMSEKIVIDARSSSLPVRMLRYGRSLLVAFTVHCLSASGSGSGMLYTITE